MRYKRLLIACAVAILCLAQFALGQSGRRVQKTASAPPPIVESQTAESTSRITTLVIGGHNIDPDTKEYWSNVVSGMVKTCTDRLKERPSPILQFIDGGKMTDKEAVERAKKQTDAYLLWFGYKTKLVGLDEAVDYVDYFVLMPQTGKTLTEGRVHIGEQRKTIDRGGVMRVPTLPRRQQRRPNIFHELDEAARTIADRVREKL